MLSLSSRFLHLLILEGGGGVGGGGEASLLMITGIGRVKTPSYTAGLKPTAASLIFLLRWCEDAHLVPNTQEATEGNRRTRTSDALLFSQSG